MFDITALKKMKLAELQQIAKLSETINFEGVKKETLISLIIEEQNKSQVEAAPEPSSDEKPKRVRIPAPKKQVVAKKAENTLFPETSIVETPAESIEIIEKEAAKVETPVVVEEKIEKKVKFNKADYEKKIEKSKSKIVPTIVENNSENSTTLSEIIAENLPEPQIKNQNQR
jgi:transcription termination factor Rho